MHLRTARAAVLAALALAASPAAASAADPGANGRIAFSTVASGSDRVVTMNQDGSGQAVINGDGYEAAWSPDGSMLSFSDLGQNGFLATMLADGSGLSGNAAGDSADSQGAYPLDQASWSPDGSKLVFSSDEQNAPGPPRQLIVVNADGSGQPSNLTPVMPQGVEHPTWSPDGSTIAFQEDDPATGPQIDEIAPNGIGMGKVGSGSEPDFSPDGRKLVFVSAGGDLWMVDADGSGAHALLSGSPCPCRDPRFSPDGAQIVFITGQPPAFAAADRSASDTTNQVQIIPAGGGTPAVAVTCATNLLSVSWQPLIAGVTPAQPMSAQQTQVCSPRKTPKPSPALTVFRAHHRLSRGRSSVHVHGRLVLPAGVSSSSGCRGGIVVWFLRPHKLIGKRTTRVRGGCRYSVSATFPKGAAPNTVILRFLGNPSLKQSPTYQLGI